MMRDRQRRDRLRRRRSGEVTLPLRPASRPGVGPRRQLFVSSAGSLAKLGQGDGEAASFSGDNLRAGITSGYHFAAGAPAALCAWRVHDELVVRIIFPRKGKKTLHSLMFDGGRTRARTLDPLIKSQIQKSARVAGRLARKAALGEIR
jgi:hypothetical protein